MDVAAVRAYIDRHYAKPLTVERLARLAGLSPFHFIRAFRAAHRVTPHRYVRDRRIERAKELLVTTPMPVTEICSAVGFQSLGTFSSLFRRLTGEAPARYRAKRRRVPPIPACFVRMYRAADRNFEENRGQPPVPEPDCPPAILKKPGSDPDE